MSEAIQYYLRKLDEANDLAGLRYSSKLIQLGHQATIDKTLANLKTVKQHRHFPSRLVIQLAKLNRPDINDILIDYFQAHFTASTTGWHAIGSLQDDRIVDTIIEAIQKYEVTYFSSKVVIRCIQLLGRIKSVTAYEALRDIVDAYFENDNHFINNYQTPLASYALDALRLIPAPEAQGYLRYADARYQQAIEAELASYPARFDKDRTLIGIDLHEGSAIKRMQKYALPTLIAWHQDNTLPQQLRDFALSSLINILRDHSKVDDKRVEDALAYVLSCYDTLKAKNKLTAVLSILDGCQHPAITQFAWQVFSETDAKIDALTILAQQQASDVYDDIVYALSTEDMQSIIFSDRALIEAYITYFGAITTKQSESMLMAFYRPEWVNIHPYLVKALANHASQSDSALDLLNHIIETHSDDYTINVAISSLLQVGNRSLPSLISVLKTEGKQTLIAIEMLGLLNHSDAVPYLIQSLLKPTITAEREQAIILALERIGTEECFATLNGWYASHQDRQ